MTEETKAGLKLLADYMGEKPITICDVHEVKHLFYSPYNTSWDALVPVYAKAMSQIDFNAPVEMERYYSDNYYIAHDTDNKQAAFEAVVELVKLIKENASPHS
jgi:hypothetical protein